MPAIPGMSPGYYVPGQAPAGVLLNTPRNMNMAGGPQYYDPSVATMRAPPQVNQQLNGMNSQSRGYNGVKPGGGSGATGSNRGTTQSGYGQPAAGGYSPNIQTGITVGGVMPQQQVQQTQNQLRNTQMTAPPQDAGQNYAPYMQHLNSLLSNGGNAAALDYGRDASFANAQQLLASQNAQSRAGTGWGGVALQQYGNQLGQQQQGLSMLLSLLGQFGV